MHQYTTWYGGRLNPGDIVLDGDPAPPKRGTASPQFSARLYFGQTVGGIKMPLILDGAQLLPPKRGQFSAHVYCGQTVAHLSCCRALVLILI